MSITFLPGRSAWLFCCSIINYCFWIANHHKYHKKHLLKETYHSKPFIVFLPGNPVSKLSIVGFVHFVDLSSIVVPGWL